tara:strand:- start:3851 stop:4150 length:300 start_codon:yes stop_codon:yes gene_type:complete
MGFNNWLINQMEILNLSRSSIARDLEVHKSTVDKWVNGLAVPRVRHVWHVTHNLLNEAKIKYDLAIEKNDSYSIVLLKHHAQKEHEDLFVEVCRIICGD